MDALKKNSRGIFTKTCISLFQLTFVADSVSFGFSDQDYMDLSIQSVYLHPGWIETVLLNLRIRRHYEKAFSCFGIILPDDISGLGRNSGRNRV